MKKILYAFGLIGLFFLLRQPAAAATISGTVVTPDGEPLPSTTVGLYSFYDDPIIAASQTTTVAADGSYNFSTESGSWYVLALPDPASDYAYNTVSNVTVVNSDDTVTENITLAATQVRGTLFQPDGETPLADWIVEVHTGDGSVYRGMVTGSDGKWNIGGLTSGLVYGVEARTTESDAPYDAPAGSVFTLSDGDAIREYELVTAGAPKTVSATVQYPDGTPVSGAVVGIYPTNGLIRHASSCYTDDAGTCTETVSSGQWLVDVNPDYSDGTMINWAYFDAPERIIFADDDTAETSTLTFTVAETNATITGQATNADGSIPRAADVHVVNSAGEGIWGKVDNETGQFSFPVIAGMLTVRIFPMNATDDAFAASEIVVLPDETYDLGNIIGLTNSATIDGRVVTGTAEAVSTIEVVAWDFANDYHLTTTTDGSGEFSFTTYPSTWTLTVTASDDYEPTAGITLELADGAESTDQTLTVKARTKTISGNLHTTDGETVSIDNFIPYAISEDNQTFTGSLQSGDTYSLTVPANNTYDVYLFFDQAAAYVMADKLTVAVAKADVADQDINVLDSTATVSGKLKDSNGETVTDLGARVIATNHFGTKIAEVDETTGQYAIDLPRGEWQLTYELLEETTDYLAQPDTTTTVDLTANEQETVSFTLLNTPHTVSGTVVDKNGDALPYVEVYLSNHDTKTAGDTARQFFATADENGQFSITVPTGEYELGAGNHPSSHNVAPAATTIAVTADLPNQDLAFEHATATLSGSVDQADGFVRAYSDTGHFYSSAIRDGEYELDIIPDETITIEAVSLDNTTLFRSLPETTTPSGDTKLNLETWKDPSVTIPAPKVMTLAADEPQVFSLGGDVRVELPSYSLGDESSGDITFIAEPTLVVQGFEYGLPINVAYDFSAKDDSGAVITSLNQPALLNIGYDEQELSALGIKEKNIQPHFADDVSGLLQNTGAVLPDKTQNEIVFVTDHFSTFTLATSQPLQYTVAQVRQLTTSKRKIHALTVDWQGVFAAKKYEIRYRPASRKSWQTVFTTKVRKQLTQLQPNTRYQIQVRARRGHQTGQWSSQYHVRTRLAHYYSLAGKVRVR